MSIRLGFIGMGNTGTGHISSLEKMPLSQIVAVCDVIEERAKEAAEPRSCAYYTDYREMLSKEEMDAVVICLPGFAREDVAIDAAKKGLNLFIEKPAAIDIETAKRWEKAIEEAGVLNSVGYMWRYSEITEKAKEMVEGRRLFMLRSSVFSGLPGRWFRQKSKSGGQIVDQSTHLIDLFRYFVGDALRVQAFGLKFQKEIEDMTVEDVTVMNIEFANGQLGNVSSTWAYKSGSLFTVELLGESLHLLLNYSANTLTGTLDGEKVEHKSSDNPRVTERKKFLSAVKAKDQSMIRSSYADAVKTLRITLAANRSIEAGQVEKV